MKVVFLIDGFNLYHTFNKHKKTRWLDVNAYCKSYLEYIDKEAKLEAIHFFSASPVHLSGNIYDPKSKVGKHDRYISILKNSGVHIHLGRFKRKTISFFRKFKISLKLYKHEEKETDVAIGIQLFDIFHNNTADIAVLVTGDTDLCPAVKIVKKNFPDKKIVNILPFRSVSRQLSDMCDQTLKTKEWRYLKHQFNDKITLKDGKMIEKPINW